MKCATGIILLLIFSDLMHAFPKPEEQNLELGNYFEGDILLTAEQKEYLLFGNRNGLIGDIFRWPGKIVFYKIAPGHFTADQENLIFLGMKHIEDSTCIRFIPANSTSTSFVEIEGLDKGCFSHVGYMGVKQSVNLQPIGCFSLGTIVHELLHTIGFFHQQSASDRDKFVKIALKNVKPEAVQNFYGASSTVVTDFGITYDYDSVMHYGAYAFSKNGEKTIITIDPDATIGQRIGLSPKDVQKLNLMYKCPGY